jgi:hypothetical protein
MMINDVYVSVSVDRLRSDVKALMSMGKYSYTSALMMSICGQLSVLHNLRIINSATYDFYHQMISAI